MEEKRTTESILDEICLKLSVYEGSYDFNGTVTAQVNDGNRFDVHEIHVNEDGFVEMEFYSDITDSFTVDEFACIENLEEICDSIEVPKELCVQVFVDTGRGEIWETIFLKMCPPDLEPNLALNILQSQFPAIYWTEDGENRWEGIPKTINNERKRVYFIAEFGDEC